MNQTMLLVLLSATTVREIKSGSEFKTLDRVMKNMMMDKPSLLRTAILMCLFWATLVIGATANDNQQRSGRIVDRDRHLVRYDSGVVYDGKSGLEWLPGPDRGTSWEQARSWVDRLVERDSRWRMPTRKELDTLYDVGDGIDNITYLFEFSGYWIWAGPPDGPPRKWLFSFSYGGEGWNGQPPSDGGRAMAVRQR